MMHLGITTMQPSGTTTTGEMCQSLHQTQRHLCSQPCSDSLSAQVHIAGRMACTMAATRQHGQQCQTSLLKRCSSCPTPAAAATQVLQGCCDLKSHPSTQMACLLRKHAHNALQHLCRSLPTLDPGGPSVIDRSQARMPCSSPRCALQEQRRVRQPLKQQLRGQQQQRQRLRKCLPSMLTPLLVWVAIRCPHMAK